MIITRPKMDNCNNSMLNNNNYFHIFVESGICDTSRDGTDGSAKSFKW